MPEVQVLNLSQIFGRIEEAGAGGADGGRLPLLCLVVSSDGVWYVISIFYDNILYIRIFRTKYLLLFQDTILTKYSVFISL